MAHNFQRPGLPYDNESLQNDKRYQIITRSDERPATDVMLDTDFNYVIDGLRQLDIDISGISAGILPGSDIEANANFLPTTDGAGNISWVDISDINIRANSVTGSRLIEQTITVRELGDGATTTNKLATNSVTTIKILDFNVTANKLAIDSVSTNKIVDLNVTADKLAANSVPTDKIVDGAITTPKILDANVTTDKIADANVTTVKILDANITTAKVADGAITLPKIAAGVLTAAASKADQITAASTTVYTNPAVQQNHPSAAKFWCSFDGTLAGTNAPISGYNVASVTRNSTGNYTINFSVPFSSSIYIVNGNCMRNTTTTVNSLVVSPIVLNQNNCIIETYYTFSNQVSESPMVYLVGYGLQ